MNALSMLLLVPVLSPQGDAPVIDQVAVEIESPAELARLRRAASDFDEHSRTRDGTVLIFADDAEQARLSELGFELRVLIEDVTDFYARRAAQDPAFGLGGASMGGFRTLSEMEAFLDSLTAVYPTIASPRFSVGTSLEGRPIWALRISDNPTVDEVGEPLAWFDALHHAREPMSGESLLLFAEWLCQNYASDATVQRLVDTRNILFIPCVNPDGYVYNETIAPTGGGMWRKNRRDNGDGNLGVDLNRNYSWEWGPLWPGSSGSTSANDYRGTSAFSEPETQAMRDYFATHVAGIAISAHCKGNVLINPWGYADLLTPDDVFFSFYADEFTALNGWPAGTAQQVIAYTANGVTNDWHYGVYGTFSFTPEIGTDTDGFWPLPSRIPALFEEVRPFYVLAARWTGGWADVHGALTTEVTGDGDAFPEPGERWQLELDAVNRGATSVHGSVRLSSASSDVAIVHATAALDVPGGSTVPTAAAPVIGVASGSATNAAHKLRTEALTVDIAPTAAVGVYQLRAELDYDGAVSIEVVPFRVGEVRQLAFDDMQSAVPGWQVVTATNGSWERADPQQSISSGYVVQPEDDDPATSGTLCWVTDGVAGASAGDGDLDGTTVLTSPRFRALGFGHLRLSYARWFGVSPAGVFDDQLTVEVSNDGGSNWSTLQIVAEDNAWRTVSFDLEQVLPLSDDMRLRVTAADDPNNGVVEACFDSLVLETVSTLPTLALWGDAVQAQVPRLHAAGGSSLPYRIQWSTQAGAGVVVRGTDGLSYLEGTVQELDAGALSGNGRATYDWTVPAGTTIHLQVLVDEGGAQAAYSNLLSVDVL